MVYMFANAKAFYQDISAWNTQNVYDMEMMFWGAEAFNQMEDIPQWCLNNEDCSFSTTGR